MFAMDNDDNDAGTFGFYQPPTYMDRLLPDLYGQWSDPEIPAMHNHRRDLDVIFGDLFAKKYPGISSNWLRMNHTEVTEYVTCSALNIHEFVKETANDYDDEEDDEIAAATQNTSFNSDQFDLSPTPSYECHAFDDAMQLKPTAIYLTPVAFQSNGADFTTNHDNGSANNTGRGSSLSCDALPFVPAVQSQTSKSHFFWLFIYSYVFIILRFIVCCFSVLTLTFAHDKFFNLIALPN